MKLTSLFERLNVRDYIKLPRDGSSQQFPVSVTEFSDHYPMSRNEPAGATDSNVQAVGEIHPDGSVSIFGRKNGGGKTFLIDKFSSKEMVDMVTRNYFRNETEVEIRDNNVIIDFYEGDLHVRSISFSYDDVYHEF